MFHFIDSELLLDQGESFTSSGFSSETAAQTETSSGVKVSRLRQLLTIFHLRDSCDLINLTAVLPG